MNTLHTSTRRTVRAGLLPAWKISALIALLTLMGLSAPDGADAATPQLGAPSIKGPGQGDNDIGTPPGLGVSSACASYAEPTLAAGLVKFPIQNRLQPGTEQSTNFNYGLYEGKVNGFRERLADFFGNGLLPPGFLIGKPQLLYDQAGDPSGYGRFVLVAAAQQPTTRRSWITLGATYAPKDFLNRSDCTYAIDANFQVDGSFTNYYADEPRVGENGTDLVVTAEMKSFADNSPKGSKLWVIPKSAVYNVPFQDCSPPHFPPSPIVSAIGTDFQNSDGTRAVAIIPAKSYDVNSSIAYLVSAYPNGGKALNLWTLDTRRLILSQKSVPAKPYSNPPPAAQPGTSTQISTGGKIAPTELVNAVYQPGVGLWTAHIAACPAGQGLGSCLKWYQINPATAIARQESFFGFSNAYVFAPWMVVNSFGDAVIPLEISGPNFYVTAYYVGRYRSDPLNTLQRPGFQLASGAGDYQRVSGTDEFGHTINAPALRSGGDVAPNNSNLFWILSGYAFGRNGTCPNKTPNFDWATEMGATGFIGAAQVRRDTTPPEITVLATPSRLLPPNGRMVPVIVSGTITDNEPAGTGVNPSTTTYAVTDSYKQMQPKGNVTLRSDGSYAFRIQLQASRNVDDKNGRRYTILVRAQDNAGNKGAGATLVEVPHD